MVKTTSDDNKITFSSDYYGFYCYKNNEEKREIYLYRIYQKDKRIGENNWILLSRKEKRIDAIKYILSSDFSPSLSGKRVIKGDFHDNSLSLLNLLKELNGYDHVTILDENNSVTASISSSLYDSFQSIKVVLVPSTSMMKADWIIKKATDLTLEEIREESMFPSRLVSYFVPSTIALSIIKFGLFSETTTSWFSYSLSPLDTFSSLPLALLYSLPDELIKVIINNNGSLAIKRDNDIYFNDDIFTVLKKEGVSKDEMCLKIRETIDKSLRLGLSMTNDEWRELIVSLSFYSDEYPRKSFTSLFQFLLSVLPGEVISPISENEESLLDIVSMDMDRSQWPMLFEEMEEREEYIVAYRENTT